MARMLLIVVVAVLLVGCNAQWTGYGQATYYNSIDHGYCGFGTNIPSNGFVAAWPFIETGPNGQGYPQPGASGQGCGSCIEVSCVPQYVESADGSIYLDRRDACADPNRAVVVRIVDECRCSLPQDSNLPKGNFNWCCNTPTPRLKINRHIDLSQQAFSALVRNGEYGLGIIGIRWRPTSCSRIGVVSINSGASVLQTLPAISEAAALVPERPTTPPTDNNWHEVAVTQEARENTQELPLLSQCGGAGADCRKFGPGNVCKDATWPGYTCAKGLICARQDQYYHQCVAPDRNNINTDGRYNVQATGSNAGTRPQGQVQGQVQSKPSVTGFSGGAEQSQPNTNTNTNNPSVSSNTSSSSSSSSITNKALIENEQCGGRGAKCGQPGYGGCADAPFAGYACGQGLTCKRQNEWYWQCEKGSGASTQGNTKTTTTSTTTSSTNSNSNTNTNTSTQKTLSGTEQCGGKGAKCSQYGACVDAQFPGYACEKGLTCKRQHQWYWQCQA